MVRRGVHLRNGWLHNAVAVVIADQEREGIGSVRVGRMRSAGLQRQRERSSRVC